MATKKKSPTPASEMTGRAYLTDYFRKLEKTLVELSTIAEMPRGDEKDTGENREYLVAEFLRKHVPRCASVVTGGVLIDSESRFGSRNPIQQVDVIVLNPFTLLAQWFPAGHYPVESAYLAVEVKSKSTHLKKPFEQVWRIKQLSKALRPETTYFGFLTEEGTVAELSSRTGSPSAGIWIWPDSQRKRSWRKELKDAVHVLMNLHGKEKPKTKKVRMPTFLYVPGQFLAFKVYQTVLKDGRRVVTVQKNSEYCFGTELLAFENGNNSSAEPFEYVIYEPPSENDGPSRLQVLAFWLAQEILKFQYEVPDTYAYAFSPSELLNRQGYGWKPGSMQVWTFRDDSGKFSWRPDRIRPDPVDGPDGRGGRREDPHQG